MTKKPQPAPGQTWIATIHDRKGASQRHVKLVMLHSLPGFWVAFDVGNSNQVLTVHNNELLKPK